MIVDAQDRFMTQRATPALARIGTALADDALLPDAPTARANSASLSRSRPARRGRSRSGAIPSRPTTPGTRPPRGFPTCSGQPCRLVAMDAHSRRDVPAARIPEVHRATLAQPVPVAFCDAFPLLVVSEESVADLNRRVGGTPFLRMDRFRPNLVLAGCDAPVRRGRLEDVPRRRGAAVFRRGVRALPDHDHRSANARTHAGAVAHPGRLSALAGGRR